MQSECWRQSGESTFKFRPDVTKRVRYVSSNIRWTGESAVFRTPSPSTNATEKARRIRSMHKIWKSFATIGFWIGLNVWSSVGLRCNWEEMLLVQCHWQWNASQYGVFKSYFSNSTARTYATKEIGLFDYTQFSIDQFTRLLGHPNIRSRCNVCKVFILLKKKKQLILIHVKHFHLMSLFSPSCFEQIPKPASAMKDSISINDFQVVTRFENFGGGWGYSGHSVEGIISLLIILMNFGKFWTFLNLELFSALRFSADSDIVLRKFSASICKIWWFEKCLIRSLFHWYHSWIRNVWRTRWIYLQDKSVWFGYGWRWVRKRWGTFVRNRWSSLWMPSAQVSFYTLIQLWIWINFNWFSPANTIYSCQSPSIWRPIAGIWFGHELPDHRGKSLNSFFGLNSMTLYHNFLTLWTCLVTVDRADKHRLPPRIKSFSISECRKKQTTAPMSILGKSHRFCTELWIKNQNYRLLTLTSIRCTKFRSNLQTLSQRIASKVW